MYIFSFFQWRTWQYRHIFCRALIPSELCQTRTTGVVDVVYVNIVLDLWVGCEGVVELVKGRAVVNRPGSRVDGNSPPRARGLVLQVSKQGAAGSKGRVDWAFYDV
jgi:hypothetical protein